MDPIKLYQLIEEEAHKRMATFEPLKKGTRFGFSLTNGDKSVYGSIHSSEMKGDIYQGITENLFNFFNSFKEQSFVILIDKINDNYLIIPFSILSKDFYTQRSEDQVHRVFNISRDPYKLVKSKVDLSGYLNNLDDLFQSLDDKSGLTQKKFDQVQNFILKEMKMQANYHPVVIKTLLESENFESTKDKIMRNLHKFNPTEAESHFESVPVYEVLEKHKIIRRNSNTFKLNISSLTEDQRQALILLCNWKIYESPLELEELIAAYNKNNNLFLSQRPSLEEREKTRKEFVSFFTEDKIKNMHLDEYVLGKSDPSTRKANRNTFSYQLEYGLEGFGSISGMNARKFGVYYDKILKSYYYNKDKYNSIEEAFNSIKNEIIKIIEAGRKYSETKNIIDLSRTIDHEKYDLPKMIRSKIFTIYYPQYFVAVNSTEGIDIILNAFGKSNNDDSDGLMIKKGMIEDIKKSHPIMREWNNLQFSDFVWDCIVERESMYEQYQKEMISSNHNISFWGIREGSEGQYEKVCIEKNIISIGYDIHTDLSSVNTKNGLREVFSTRHSNTNYDNENIQQISQVWNFLKLLKKEDIVFLPHKSIMNAISIGIVKSNYYFDPNSPYRHQRKVEWIVTGISSEIFDSDFIRQLQSRRTLFKLEPQIAIKNLRLVCNDKVLPLSIFGIREENNKESSENNNNFTIERLIDLTLFSSQKINEILEILKVKRQIILYGPPGTSKTFFAKLFSEFFTGNKDYVELIQFHPSYSYEDFIEGIKPRIMDNEKVSGFYKKEGIFKNLAKKASENPDQNYVLIIDEINRGNISKIFGELIYLLEYRDEKIQLTYSANMSDKFSIPSNLYIIGTMNSADHSLAFVDYALRRRFYFIEFYPDLEIFERWLSKYQENKEIGALTVEMLRGINEKITKRIGKEYSIGFSYFMIPLEYSRLSEILKYAIIPQVEQYYFGKKEYIDEISSFCYDILERIKLIENSSKSG